MTGQEKPRRPRKPYSTPRVVDFGPIATMTGECYGICLDGENGAGRGD